MADIEYPSEKLLRYWIGLLESPGITLGRFLPKTDDEWFREMMGVIERAQIYPSADIHDQAARIFHNAIKNHHFVDGNKRSGVVLIYLFYYINDYLLAESGRIMGITIRKLARGVARIKGNLTLRQMVALRDQLERNSVPQPKP